MATAKCSGIDMNKEELVQIFDQFLNEHGQWQNFKDYIEGQGYTLSELGFPDED